MAARYLQSVRSASSMPSLGSEDVKQVSVSCQVSPTKFPISMLIVHRTERKATFPNMIVDFMSERTCCRALSDICQAPDPREHLLQRISCSRTNIVAAVNEALPPHLVRDVIT